jgi:hypothetical protein
MPEDSLYGFQNEFLNPGRIQKFFLRSVHKLKATEIKHVMASNGKKKTR